MDARDAHHRNRHGDRQLICHFAKLKRRHPIHQIFRSFRKRAAPSAREVRLVSVASMEPVVAGVPPAISKVQATRLPLQKTEGRSSCRWTIATGEAFLARPGVAQTIVACSRSAQVFPYPPRRSRASQAETSSRRSAKN